MYSAPPFKGGCYTIQGNIPWPIKLTKSDYYFFLATTSGAVLGAFTPL